MASAFSTLPLSGVSLPSNLTGLEQLATNIDWTWHKDVQDLFAEIEPTLWIEKRGPAEILRRSHRLPELSQDPSFVKRVETEAARLEKRLGSQEKSWFPNTATRKELLKEGPVAYFCAEYALFEGFNQYAGGLGVLAGDHCKEASDLGLPFVAVGLFYRRGFFHQMVDWSGRQEHLYKFIEPDDCGCLRLCEPGSQNPLTLTVPMEGRGLRVAVWLQMVGRVPMILLDTDVEGNGEADKAITSQLYCNSRSMRLHQETVLGIGGVKALRALGIHPRVWHLNEGHSAFLLVERLREFLGEGMTLGQARLQVAKDSLITIHTPVPEGNERFDGHLAAKLLAPLVAGTPLKAADLLKWGLGSDGDKRVFDMTAFALRHSKLSNGVSLLHGRTADKTWRSVTGREVIGVTNGAHVPTWLGPEMKRLFKEVGADFTSVSPFGLDGTSGERPVWEPALRLDGKKLWEAHRAQKRELLKLIEVRLREQLARHGEGPEVLEEVGGMLREDGFLIGFARRFAPYKRASLVLTQSAKAKKLLGDKSQPVQIVFSGKSHPSDRTGQSLVEKVFQETRSPQYKGRLFYLEDYDLELGRALSQGVDAWLNNPRRPLEASGTSGMKAAMNGIPNVSILDGWWDEGFVDGQARNGWAIGDRTESRSVEAQDKRDAVNLYKVLEDEVIPCFFKRDASGLPSEWIQVMRQAVATSVYSFSTSRMIRDYWEKMYASCADPS